MTIRSRITGGVDTHLDVHVAGVGGRVQADRQANRRCFRRETLELVDELRRPGQRVNYTMQTNGVLVDERWAAFFKEHGFLVGISVDGPRELHDCYRVDKRGNGSFDRVKAAARRSRSLSIEPELSTTKSRSTFVYPWLLNDSVI